MTDTDTIANIISRISSLTYPCERFKWYPAYCMSMNRSVLAIIAVVLLAGSSASSRSKGTEYYAERLLSQAIADPDVNALSRDGVRAYIEEEAEKLCIPPEETADYAMRGYDAITTGDFKSGTEYPHFPTVNRTSNKEPPF